MLSKRIVPAASHVLLMTFLDVTQRESSHLSQSSESKEPREPTAKEPMAALASLARLNYLNVRS